MKILYEIALIIHVASGVTALISGLIAILSKKGKKWHVKAGIIYFYGMLCIAITAIFISILKHNNFLLHIGIFSFFMVYSGYRSIKNKSLKPNALDWIVLLTAFINSVFMITSLKMILMVFGGLGFFLAVSDFRIFMLVKQHKEIAKNQWLLRHIGMMLGAYISTSTAFIVVNVSWLQYAWVPWLLPTIIGTPMIVYWITKYKSKKKEAR